MFDSVNKLSMDVATFDISFTTQSTESTEEVVGCGFV